MKKLTRIIFVIISFMFLTGCGELDPSTVDNEFLIKSYKEKLKYWFGTDFEVEISNFSSSSDRKESNAIVYPKNNSSIKASASGLIEEDGSNSSYVIKTDFETILWDSINKELNSKYNFKITDETNLSELSSSINDYMDDIKNMLEEYKNGTYFKTYFNDKYKVADITFIINNIKKQDTLVLEKESNKIIIDKTEGEYSWIGELELEEYLELLKNDKLDDKICEIMNEHYPDDLSKNCKE